MSDTARIIYNGRVVSPENPLPVNVVEGNAADKVSYDNTTSGLTATDVQGAIDEVYSESLQGVSTDSSISGTGTALDPLSVAHDNTSPDTAGAGITFGHINDLAQTIAGIKTFSDNVEMASGKTVDGLDISEFTYAETSGTLPLLWNKLGSTAEATNSEYGADFIEVGTPEYVLGVFDNAYYISNAANRLYANINAADYNNISELTVEFWLKTDYAVTNGAKSGDGVTLFDFNRANGSEMIRVLIDANQLWVEPVGGGSTATFTQAALTWAADTWVHFAVVWNRSSSVLGGSNKVAIYINGAQAGVSTVDTGEKSGVTQFDLGWHHPPVPQEAAQAAFDNIKIWNFAKTDFSDRDTEGVSVTTVNKLLHLKDDEPAYFGTGKDSLIQWNSAGWMEILGNAPWGAWLASSPLWECNLGADADYAYLAADRTALDGFATSNALLVGRGETRVNSNQRDCDFTINTLDTAGTFFVDGGTHQVGIGTSAPENKLDVIQNTTGYQGPRFRNSNNGTSSGTFLRMWNDGTAQAGMVRLSSNNSNFSGKNSLSLYTASSHPIGLITNGLVRVLVEGGGNVGIGTATPSEKLEVNGSLKLADNASIKIGTDLKVDCGTEKTIELVKSVWDDIQFNVETGRTAQANAPDWDGSFTTNTGCFKFDVNDYIDLGTNEMLHWWKEGTNIYPHIHVALNGANGTGASRYVKFTIFLAYANDGGAYAETNRDIEIEIPNGTADRVHLFGQSTAIDFTGIKIGAQVNVRLKRIAATSGTEYANDIFVTQVGLHAEKDTMGSRKIGTK